MSPEWSAPSVMAVRNVPWWGLLSSGAAPVLMVGGWMVATSLQPRSVDPMAERSARSPLRTRPSGG